MERVKNSKGWLQDSKEQRFYSHISPYTGQLVVWLGRWVYRKMIFLIFDFHLIFYKKCVKATWGWRWNLLKLNKHPLAFVWCSKKHLFQKKFWFQMFRPTFLIDMRNTGTREWKLWIGIFISKFTDFRKEPYLLKLALLDIIRNAIVFIDFFWH